MLRYRLLGPLEIRRGRAVVPVTGARQAKVLAALLLAANTDVAVARLVDVVWDDDPPASAAKVVRNCVSLVRAVLERAGAPGALVTTAAGYRLVVGDDELDLALFQAARRDADALAAGGDLRQAAVRLREALDLWRGPALAGTGSPALRPAIDGLDEQHLAAWERYADLELALGEHGRLVGPLIELTAAHPLREPLVGQLMLALWRDGRQADALDAYTRLRGDLRRELGVDPHPRLAELYRRVLGADPALSPDQPGPAAPVPRQLPASIGHFTGRTAELAAMTGLLERGSGGTVLVSAIDGTAGVGKTALAVRWAHQVGDRFPDGQLFLDLRGFDPSAVPVPADAAIRSLLLDAFAIDPQRLPAGADRQAALFRSVCAGKRLLILLDNARDTAQVRPLLPGGPHCMVVVTSRNQLTGLTAADGAHPITLDLLSTAEAHALLAGRLGRDRIVAEPDAVDELIEQCARLPLALNIVAARAAADSRSRLVSLADELRDARERLDVLGTDDPSLDVRAVLACSYDRLPAAAARVFRLLSCHPGPDISLAAATSLTGLDEPASRAALTVLARAHLLEHHRAGRYRHHDLLRAYATELTHRHDTAGQRRAAVHRLLDHYLHSAATAGRVLDPVSDPPRLAAPRPDVTPERLTGYRQAWDWFTAEHQVLLGAVRLAAETGFDAHVGQLAWAVATFLHRHGSWQDRVTVERAAVAAARRLADAAAEARAHQSLGYASMWLRSLPDAGTHLRQAIALHQRQGDAAGQARCHIDLALVCEQQHDLAAALDHARQALRLARRAGHRANQARALNAVGWFHARLGQHRPALTHCRQALELHRSLGNVRGQADTSDSLGFTYHQLGDHPRALTHYRRALELFRTLGDRYEQALTLDHLGDTHRAAGDRDAAGRAWRQALAILTDLGHPTAAQLQEKLAAG